MESVVKLNRKLGVGGRGVVYEGFDHAKGHFVAVKEMAYMEPSVAGVDEEDTELMEILSELACMREAQHPNLVQYYGARRSAVGVQIIMEYVSGGSLDYVLTRCGPLRESVARAYTRDVLAALQYLHEVMHVCHRDVKPANILITPEGRCKLADFGVAKQMDDATGQQQQQQRHEQPYLSHASPSRTSDSRGPSSSLRGQRGPSGVREGYLQTAVGTPWYMAPEVINGGVDDDDDDEEDDGEGSGSGTADSARVERPAQLQSPSMEEDGSLEDWSNAGPTASDGDSPLPARPPPQPLYATGGGYYNPLKRILRKGRLPRSSVGYTTRADIWSVGVTVYEMLTGTRPFGADLHNPSAVMFRIANCATAPPRLPLGLAVSPTVQNFLDLCFVYDKDLRATARELLGHPWLRGAAPPLSANGRNGSSSSASVHVPRQRSESAGQLQQQQLSSPLPPPPSSSSVRQSVFDGVAALDAMDLPPYPPPLPHTDTFASTGGSGSGSGHAGGSRAVLRGEGRARPPVQRLSSANHLPAAPHHHAAPPLVAASSSGALPSALREASPVSLAEQAEASSRYAAARQRIGHPRAPTSTTSTSLLPAPHRHSSSAAAAAATASSGGGLQTKYGAFVDLLSHP